MLKHSARVFLSITLIQSLVFSPIANADQLALPANDLTAPDIVHEPITTRAKEGTAQVFSATVTDNIQVKAVTLFYRAVGAQEYNRKPMRRNLDSNEYTTTIENIPATGVEYYIQAEDTQGNSVLHGYSFSPLILHAESAGGDSATETAAENDTATGDGEPASSSGVNKWVWVGLGVLAVGAIASSSSGGDKKSSSTGTVTVETPLP